MTFYAIDRDNCVYPFEASENICKRFGSGYLLYETTKGKEILMGMFSTNPYDFLPMKNNKNYFEEDFL